MNHKIAINTYRLRKLAMGMGVFTANNLASAAKVSNQTVQDFLGAVREENPKFLQIEQLPPLKPGRRVNRYTLTPEGLAHLATANAPFAREINDTAFATDPALQAKPVTIGCSRSSWKKQIESWLAKVLPEFQTVIDEGASALLMKPGEAGAARFGQRICPSCTEHVWALSELESALQGVFNPLQQERLAKQGWTAYAHTSENHAPIEIYAKLVGGQPVLELRFLPKHVPTLEDLRLPPLVDYLSSQKAGFILVTGLAGSGKSATIAAMIGNINSKEPGHITTIDEPIRYFHSSQRSFVEQRQIAIDIPDFSPAIEQALADRSSVVAVSDVPDRESFSTILAAANRALIVCRVAAPSPAEAIRKLINLVPDAEQSTARTRLAESLSGIICVASLPDTAGTGMVSATEVLGWRPEAREAIVNPERTGFLVEELARVDGRMESLGASVRRLYGEGLISGETAGRCEMLDRNFFSRT